MTHFILNFFHFGKFVLFATSPDFLAEYDDASESCKVYRRISELGKITEKNEMFDSSASLMITSYSVLPLECAMLNRHSRERHTNRTSTPSFSYVVLR